MNLQQARQALESLDHEALGALGLGFGADAPPLPMRAVPKKPTIRDVMQKDRLRMSPVAKKVLEEASKPNRRRFYKTTTLRMVLGLASPTSGRALVFDGRYAELEHPALRIGAVSEATDFHPDRSGRDHLRMLGRAVDVPDSRVDEVLSLVELTEVAHRRVKGYSLGMRQRLGLAAALLGGPGVADPRRAGQRA